MWSFFSKIIDTKGGVGFLLGLLMGVLVTLQFVQTKYYPLWFSNKETKEIDINQNKSTSDEAVKPLVDLSGKWMLINTIEGANDSKYDNLELKFKMYLDQDKNDLAGTIVKFMEGNDSIPKTNQIQINLKGRIEGYKAVVNYEEKGKIGTFEWVFNDENKKLEGRFKSTLAISRGKSIAHRRVN